MAIARFLDRMCLALRAFGLWLCYATLQDLPSGNTDDDDDEDPPFNLPRPLHPLSTPPLALDAETRR